jgi:hypothetical protein
VKYNLLFQRGDLAMCSPVVSWLSKDFDCVLSPLRLSPALLLQFAGRWIQRAPLAPIELHFEAPAVIAEQGLSHFTVAVTGATMRLIDEA